MTISPAKTAELREMSFGGQTRVGPKNHVLDGFHYMDATWQIRLNDPYSAGMRAVATISVATCYHHIVA